MIARSKAMMHDVAISGAGVVGSTLAGLLALQNFKVCLISGSAQPDWNSQRYHPRVNAVNNASIRIFRHLGVWTDIRSKRMNPYYQMEVWENDTGGTIRFDAKQLRVPHLGVVVENTVLISSLFDFLKQQANVSIIDMSQLEDISVKDEGLDLQTNTGHRIGCRLLIGADGADSITRTLSNIDKLDYQTGQQAIVAELAADETHAHTAWQVFLPTGPAALLPLERGRYSLVWSCDDEYYRQLMALDDAAFCEVLTSSFQGRPGKIVETGERYSFVLRQHQAGSYIANRVALIGDAAHSIHPLAGLGANMGLLDAAVLSQLLGEAGQRNCEFDAYSVLRRYERWRKGENALVLDVMRGFKALFGKRIQGSRRIGGAGLGIVNRLRPVKKILAGLAMGDIGDLPVICSAAKNSNL